ncbi:hypothetical protein SDRG_16654 [Saprolegnia diclina VS20]|uniref:Uncharacterized protein n=1 Tax=Saprolegnia diclina (strain VS20) TaxID=1156394 RepID=T0R0J8_SAPDV|nr:hypothetical protein SDRG_16654 [Saprolegnia diclina VS20]EQC25483.1 hypothetical protein SDRG_16654 [Saprolegnia diclina VS20]|eukprot:XP_008621092.1 hypothetical protein SDRG_16654 [Saprolegnia diclina VS20]
MLQAGLPVALTLQLANAQHGTVLFDDRTNGATVVESRFLHDGAEAVRFENARAATARGHLAPGCDVCIVSESLSSTKRYLSGRSIVQHRLNWARSSSSKTVFRLVVHADGSFFLQSAHWPELYVSFFAATSVRELGVLGLRRGTEHAVALRAVDATLRHCTLQRHRQRELNDAPTVYISEDAFDVDLSASDDESTAVVQDAVAIAVEVPAAFESPDNMARQMASPALAVPFQPVAQRCV